MLPGQTCPEHRHPAFDGTPGKEETSRCRKGLVYLCIEGAPASDPIAARQRQNEARVHGVERGDPPPRRATASPAHHAPLVPVGAEGAIVSAFSTRSRDDLDVFTDPDIARATVVSTR